MTIQILDTYYRVPTMVEYVERMTGEKWVENVDFAEAQTQLHLLKEL